MTEKQKNHKSIWKRSIPIWSVVVIIALLTVIFIVSLPPAPKPILPRIITATPGTYGAPQTNYTFISPLGSPTPFDLSTEDEQAQANLLISTPLCSDIERSLNGQFVFRMFLQVGMELFRVDEDGANLCRLTDNDVNDDYPAWSPDGEQIAFVRSDPYGLYIMDADGTQIKVISTGGTTYSYPSWSPDGNYLIFQATFNEMFDIYQIRLADGEIINLTNQERLDTTPRWASDDRFIVFSSDRTFNPFIGNRLPQDENYEIYMMNADGANSRRLTSNDVTDAYPSFSPDNTEIVFVSGYNRIMIMNLDGSNQRFLAEGTFPIWLPDNRIAFVAGNITVVNPDGSNEKTLTDIPLFGSGIENITYTLPR